MVGLRCAHHPCAGLGVSVEVVLRLFREGKVIAAELVLGSNVDATADRSRCNYQAST